MGAGLCACGESGSSPVEFPEVRIEVRPAGPATFRVASLIGGGNNHVLPQEFTATSVFTFVLENAGPPYEAKFTRVSGGDITVVLTLISASGQTQVTDATGAGKDTARVVVEVAGGTSPIPTPVPGRLEVRFDVCAPAAGGTCLGPSADAGTFGVLFSGTVGDQFDSHVLNGTTPTIHFLEGARDNVNAVFTRLSLTGDPLVVHLLIDGQLHQTGASAADVVIREDL
jgi:hypothetical protein